MRGFMIFCLSTLGVVSLLTVAAGAGAAGLYYWHGEGGCDSLPRSVRVVTEGSDGAKVYELTPGRTGCCPGDETPNEAVDETGTIPLPTPLAVPAPIVPQVGPTQADLDELRARLADALQRIAALEAQRTAGASTPATPPAPVDDF